eukprot:3934948-Pleurochrysis_carterae.AAC.2
MQARARARLSCVHATHATLHKPCRHVCLQAAAGGVPRGWACGDGFGHARVRRRHQGAHRAVGTTRACAAMPVEAAAAASLSLSLSPFLRSASTLPPLSLFHCPARSLFSLFAVSAV